MSVWKPQLTALFITVHFACILLHLMPFPPRMDRATLALPDVREEIDHMVAGIDDTFHPNMSRAQLRTRLIEGVRQYNAIHEPIRELVRLYLAPTGQIQTWNMFGGTPPKRPRVIMAEVRPMNAAAFVPFLDGQWGTEADQRFSFRHRKAQERLSIPGKKRERTEYAAYVARLWQAQHPAEPISAVRLYFLQLHTQGIAQVRAGKPVESPRVVEDFIWEPTIREGAMP